MVSAHYADCVSTLSGKSALANIPSQIEEVYEALKVEITWLHGRWIIYRQLFGKLEKRVDLLNECAPAFFYLIQNVLLGEIQVSLCKLTDPARTGGKENLSLGQLQQRIEHYGGGQLATPLTCTLREAHEYCTPFRKWRNKRLAHLDLSSNMKSSSNILPGISRKMIEEALECVRRYMNQIEVFYHDNEIAYEDFIMSRDGDSLVQMLKYGLRYQELLREEVLEYDDWRRGKWFDA